MRQKIFVKIFMVCLKGGSRCRTNREFVGVVVGVEQIVIRERIKLQVTPKNEVEKPRVLVIDLGISTKKGRVSTVLGKLGKLRKFVRGPGKVRKI